MFICTWKLARLASWCVHLSSIFPGWTLLPIDQAQPHLFIAQQRLLIRPPLRENIKSAFPPLQTHPDVFPVSHVLLGLRVAPQSSPWLVWSLRGTTASDTQLVNMASSFCRWYSCMLGKKCSLAPLKEELRKQGVSTKRRCICICICICSHSFWSYRKELLLFRVTW